MSLRKNLLASLFTIFTIAFGSTAFAVYPYPIKPYPYPYPYPQPTTANDGTGLTLGVYVQQNYYGMQIIGLMPNSSAQFAGLRSGDVLIEMFANNSFYPTTNLYELRAAKMAIGPNQLTYVRVFRPGFGEFFPTVTFQADGFGPGPATAFSKQGVASAAIKAAPHAKWGGETEMSKKIFKDRPALKIDPKFNQTLKVDPKVKSDLKVKPLDSKIIVPEVKQNKSQQSVLMQ